MHRIPVMLAIAVAPLPTLAGPFLGASIGQGEVDRPITERLITSGAYVNFGELT